MGIFDAFTGAVERFAGSEFGQAAFGIAGQAIAARFAPQVPTGRLPPVLTRGPVPPALQPGGFVGAGGTFVDTRTPAQLAQLAFESLGGGPPMPGVFQTVATVQAPQPVPFGLDPSCPSFFPTGGATARPARFITATNPVTGALTWWEHAGQPILFSRDLRVVKRVRRIASKAGVVTRRRTRKR